MFDKMKQLMELQKKAKEAQRVVEAIRVEKKTSDGKIGLIMTGTHRLENVSIDTSYLSPDKKADLEQTLTRLVTEAGEEVQKQVAAQTMGMMKGLGLPGF